MTGSPTLPIRLVRMYPLLRRASFAASLSVTLFVTGCATPARTDQMTIPATAVTGIATPEALKGAIGIQDVTGGGETNPMWLSKVGTGDFERALEGSLRAVGMLAPVRLSSRYALTADLRKLDQPIVGFNMTVTATVDYALVERASGRTVFRETVATPYTAKVGEAFIATERLKLANEGAVRANIQQLIESLARRPLGSGR